MNIRLFLKNNIVFMILLLILCSSILSINTFAKTYTVEELRFENSHFIKVDDVEMHYRIWKPEDKVPIGNILLIHGLGGSTFSWRKVAKEIANLGYLVVAIDLPGFGLSQRKPAAKQSNNDRANLIWKLIADLNIPGNWHLVGHSMGGGVVAAMVLQYPFKAVSLTLVAGSFEHNSSLISKILSRSRILRNITGKIFARFALSRKKIKSFLASAYGREPTSEEIEGYYLPLKIKNTYLTFANLLKNYSSDKELFGNLNTINLPTLCIWGRDDSWVPISQGEAVSKIISNARFVVIEGAYHCPMETHPELFNEYLTNFLPGI